MATDDDRYFATAAASNTSRSALAAGKLRNPLLLISVGQLIRSHVGNTLLGLRLDQNDPGGLHEQNT